MIPFQKKQWFFLLFCNEWTRMKCKNEHEKLFKEEESVEILKILV